MPLITSDKKEFPAQTRERMRWIIDTVRENQATIWPMMSCLHMNYPKQARIEFNKMHKQDRDAMLVKGGILTDDQIALLMEKSP